MKIVEKHIKTLFYYSSFTHKFYILNFTVITYCLTILTDCSDVQKKVL